MSADSYPSAAPLNRPSPTVSPSAASPISAFTKRLAEYKELIAILVFFAGGVMWIVGYFATKTQLKELRCFAKESVTVARAEFELRTTFEDMVQRSRRLDELETKSKSNEISESERFERIRLQQEAAILSNRREDAEKRFKQSEKMLLDNLCSQGE